MGQWCWALPMCGLSDLQPGYPAGKGNSLDSPVSVIKGKPRKGKKYFPWCSVAQIVTLRSHLTAENFLVAISVVLEGQGQSCRLQQLTIDFSGSDMVHAQPLDDIELWLAGDRLLRKLFDFSDEKVIM